MNVSRSALQNDGFVKKISDYITKKVADKLSGMCKTDRENYEKYWDDISPFIKYGCLKDQKFREKMTDYLIFKDLDGKYITLPDYIEEAKKNEPAKEETESTEAKSDETADAENGADADNADKEEEPTTVYYATDLQQQSQYVKMFREQDMNAVVLLHNIDQPFVSALEAGDDDVKFQRIDADLTDAFKEEGDEEKLKEDTETLKELFRKATGKDQLEVKVEKLKNDKVSSMITLSEEARRMQDMMKMYSANGMGGMELPDVGQTLVLNANNDLVQYLLANKDGEHSDMFCKQLYDLAMISHQPLQADKMTEFINRSNEIMMLLTK